ncbi:MAG TPA: N-acetylneuraminate synthase family protein [Candidatus Lokiarchaeia archaeon]
MKYNLSFISDVSSNHCNNLQIAKDLIYESKSIGCQHAKFQYWETENFINKKNFKKIGNLSHQAKWKNGVYGTYKKYQLKEHWIPILYDECKKVDIDFMLSCYELSKIDDFDKYVTYWKIGSGDINYWPILEKIASKKKPIILAIGAATYKDIKETLEYLTVQPDFILKDLTLLHCNTVYDGNDMDNLKYMNLSFFETLKLWQNQYDIQYGLSDHARMTLPIISAVSLGATWFERHLKLSDNNSPDSKFSMNPKQFKGMIEAAKLVYESLGDGIKKIEENERETRIVQRRSNITWDRPDIECWSKNK